MQSNDGPGHIPVSSRFLRISVPGVRLRGRSACDIRAPLRRGLKFFGVLPIPERVQESDPIANEAMIRPVSASRPVDVLRRSSDEIRRAAELLAEIAVDTAPHPGERLRTSLRLDRSPEEYEDQAARDATIAEAQRNFMSSLRTAR